MARGERHVVVEYAYPQMGVGSTPVRVRAMDDSANIGTAVSRSTNVACPCSVLGNEVPAMAASDDVNRVELGLLAVGDGFVAVPSTRAPATPVPRSDRSTLVSAWPR